MCIYKCAYLFTYTKRQLPQFHHPCNPLNQHVNRICAMCYWTESIMKPHFRILLSTLYAHNALSINNALSVNVSSTFSLLLQCGALGDLYQSLSLLGVGKSSNSYMQPSMNISHIPPLCRWLTAWLSGEY